MNRAFHRLGRKYLNKKKFDEPFLKWRIKKGDRVQIIGPLSGKDIGKQGIVKEVLRKKNRVNEYQECNINKPKFLRAI